MPDACFVLVRFCASFRQEFVCAVTRISHLGRNPSLSLGLFKKHETVRGQCLICGVSMCGGLSRRLFGMRVTHGAETVMRADRRSSSFPPEEKKKKEKAKVEHFRKLDCRYTIRASHYTCSSDVGWAEWSRNARLNTGKVFPLSVLSVSIFLHFFGIGGGRGGNQPECPTAGNLNASTPKRNLNFLLWRPSSLPRESRGGLISFCPQVLRLAWRSPPKKACARP